MPRPPSVQGHNWAVAAIEDGPTTGGPLVQVQLLGSFVISVGEKMAGPWPRTSTKRLLALVLLSPKRRISEEAASDTLFGDLAPRAATNAMYNALSGARSVLAGLGGPAAGMLRTDRTHLYVPGDAPVVVDLDLHEGALSAALQMPPGAGRDAVLVELLAEERGLLEDEAYADWVLRRHDSLKLARQRACLALARDRSAGFGQSGPEAVISAWDSYAAHDPASEEAAVALMSAYAAQGQRHLMARAYRRCCDGLEELGLKRSVALEEAYKAMGQELTRVATPHSADGVGRMGNLPTYLSSFVGREAEQAEVGSLVRSWRLVTVTGAGGRARPAWPWRWPPTSRTRDVEGSSSSNWPRSGSRARCRWQWLQPWACANRATGLSSTSCAKPSPARTSSSSSTTVSTLSGQPPSWPNGSPAPPPGCGPWPPRRAARHRRRAGVRPGPAQLAPRGGQVGGGPGGF